MIEIKDLHYKYHDGTKALEGINLRVEKGTVALIGKNGAGKSTLLNHLNGILKPTSGNVLVDGIDVQKDEKHARKKIGLVFQNPDDMLFSPTVYEDVAFGPKNLKMNNVDDVVKESLQKVGMLNLADKNPHHLSMGQKKKVSIAAVISMRPSVIVFDEPTSHLDPKSRREIMELINSLDCTKIISTHDMSLLRHCDYIHVLHDGKLVYSGKNIDEKELQKWELA